MMSAAELNCPPSLVEVSSEGSTLSGENAKLPQILRTGIVNEKNSWEVVEGVATRLFLFRLMQCNEISYIVEFIGVE